MAEEQVTTAEQVIAGAARDRSNTTVRLEGSRDKSSGKGVFPAIPATSPSAPRYEPLTLSAEGTLYSYTVIHPSPKSGLPPFVVAYADFTEGVRVFGRLQMLAGERPRIGMTVCTVSAESGDAAEGGRDGYLFVPAGECVA